MWPRITDDGGELNIQLNAMMYDHEETIAGSLRYGVTGVLGQLNKARGTEPSAQYIAEGAWNPQIRCQTFYEGYLRRLFGPAALDALLNAYVLLEENEKTLGWHGRRRLFGTYHHGNRMGVALRRVDYKQARPSTRPPAGRKGYPGRRTRNESSGPVARPTAARPWSCCDRPVPLSRPVRARRAGVRDLQDRELRHGARRSRRRATQAQAVFDRALLAMNAGDSDDVRHVVGSEPDGFGSSQSAGPPGRSADDPLCPHPDRATHPVPLQRCPAIARSRARLPGRGHRILQGQEFVEDAAPDRTTARVNLNSDGSAGIYSHQDSINNAYQRVPMMGTTSREV